MKKLIYSLTTVLLLFMLAFAITSCDEDDGNGDGDGKPTAISITPEGQAAITTSGTEISMVEGNTLTLSMKVTGGGAANLFFWKIAEADEEFLELTDDETATVNVKGLKATEGVNLTATAGNTHGSASLTVKIKVTASSGTVSLEVKDGVAAVSSSLSLDEGDTKALTATTTPDDATVSWDSNNASVTVSPATGKSVTLTAVSEGSATITVTATKDGYTTATKTISVTVSAAADPNLIWEWNYGDDNGPKGTALAQDVSGAYLVGTGSHAQAATMPITIAMSTDIVDDPTNNGILLDASGTRNAVFLIGTSVSLPASTSASSPDGVFDFKNHPSGKKIKITISGQFLQAALGNRSFSVSLNNTTTGAANTPIGTNATGDNGRIFFWQNTPGDTGAPSNHATNGNWNSAQNLVECAPFNNTLTDTNDFLRRAFISIVAMNTSASNTGCKFLLKGIKIEYID